MDEIGARASAEAETRRRGGAAAILLVALALTRLVSAAAAATPTWANPIDFGAKFDGVSDDTAAWRAAVKSATEHGLSLQVPCGHARLSGAITISEALLIHGSGARCTLIETYVGPGEATFRVIGINPVTISGLGILCKGDGQVGIRVHARTEGEGGSIQQPLQRRHQLARHRRRAHLGQSLT